MVWNIGITMTYTYYTLLSADFVRLQPLCFLGTEELRQGQSLAQDWTAHPTSVRAQVRAESPEPVTASHGWASPSTALPGTDIYV